jgi:hypothetical protein
MEYSTKIRFVLTNIPFASNKFITLKYEMCKFITTKDVSSKGYGMTHKFSNQTDFLVLTRWLPFEGNGVRDESLCLNIIFLPCIFLRNTILKMREGVPYFMLQYKGGEEQASVKKTIITEYKRGKVICGVTWEPHVCDEGEVCVTSVVHRTRSSFVVVSRYVGV